MVGRAAAGELEDPELVRVKIWSGRRQPLKMSDCRPESRRSGLSLRELELARGEIFAF